MKTKFLIRFLVLIIMAAIVAGCIFAYNTLTKEPPKTEEINIDVILFKKSNYPKVDASTATQPLATAFASEFTGDEFTSSDFDYTTTHPAYLKLIAGEVDLIIVTEPSEEELVLARDAGIELEVIPVSKEAFVFYVNENNPVDSLTFEEVQKIYSGEITNWKEVGGNDAKIRALQRPLNSGSQTGLLSLVMNGKKLVKPETEDIAESMSDILNIVSSYDNGIDSIGYSYYYYANTIYDTTDSGVSNAVKLLAINGVKPTNKTIQNETYPIGTAYYIVINKSEPDNGNVRKLIEAMLSERGQKVVEETGYVRVK